MGANPIWQAEELARFLHCPRRVYLDRRAGRHPAGPELAARAAETRARLQAGAAVVEEAVLTDGRLTARFPCLEREAGASRLGSFRYRPRVAAADGRDLVDGLLTALAGLPLLTALQGAEPAIRLAGAGGGEVDFDPARGRAFVHWARQRLEAFLAAGEEPYPHPVAACAACPWQAACRARREGDDHLSLVAGIRPRQIRLLEVAGIRTVAGLAASGPETRVPGLGRATLERLRLQARLQLEARRRGSPVTVVLPAEPGRGLARLPAPAPGDLGAGVEEQPGADGGVRVTAVWWGRLNAPAQVSRAAGEEGHLFRVLVEALEAARRQNPDCHVHHFGPGLADAVRRLMGCYPGREAVVDDWLRSGFLVDLARVLREGVAVSLPVEQAEDLLPLWGGTPEGEGAALRLAALAGLRQWLWQQQQDVGAGPRPVGEGLTPAPLPAEAEPPVPAEPPFDLLAALREFHRREDKVYWWHYFDSRSFAGDDWIEDPEAVGGLEYDGPQPDGTDRYRFPPQETRVKPGDRVLDGPSGREAGLVTALDPVRGQLHLQPLEEGLRPQALLPGFPPPKRVLAEALAGLAAAGGDLARRHPALWAVLTRQEPRFRGLVPGQPLLQPGESPQAAARRLALLLDHSYLVVQGPPGTGKTWTGAALVVDLLRAGRRVGVMAHSHQVVAHLLEGVAAAAAGAGLSVPMLQKVSGPGQAARVPDLQVVTAARRVERALRDRQPVLVGGTAWLFARRALTGKLDVLVMDEAGQLSLADALAAGQAADALILLGDPRQLNQPVQGSHPPGAAVSVLEHLLEGRPIVPPERGIFLDESRRLHPDLAGFLSRWVYEGRLRAHPACAGQAVGGGKPWAGTGLRFVPVAHHGRRTASPEEGEVVARLWQALVGRPWRGRSGRLRRLGPEDVLVVAPFNAQVTLLQHLLPPGARVGTVDKFQGQEAPVVLYSLAASSLEDLPRGAEFLFSLNRLNVAVSRAQALAVLVANPGLLTAAPPGLEALALMNTVAALVLEATVVPPEATGP
ncbi:MAG: AAA domain-containing protein [Firmicutes bacterium]|nr:AAA domain-containing protein [Bacillota bacterium]